jgi:hypothetical protein
LCARGRFHGEIKAFDRAIQCFEKAVAIDDRAGRVPVKVVEQLANFEARMGEDCKDMQLIHRGIKRLQALLQAAGGGSDDGPVNSERCALLGSAYKRLAGILDKWSVTKDDTVLPKGIEKALELSTDWYGKGEGEYGRSGFEPYNVQNRLALKAILGIADMSDAEQVRHIGEFTRRRYFETRDVWDLIMTGDGELIAAIIDKHLMETSQKHVPCDSVIKIIDRYKRLMKTLPKSKREFDSVVTQVRLLKKFVEKRKAFIEEQKSAEEGQLQELKNLADNLGRIAKALDPVDHRQR